MAATRSRDAAIRVIKGLELRPEGRSIESAQHAGFTVCLLLVGTGKATDRSARLHNSAYELMKSPFIYLTSDTADIRSAVAEIRERGIRGASVSIPYKQDVMALLDDVDETAKAIGAVNTVVNDNGLLYGYNSDWIGALNAIEERAQIKPGTRAILAGAGGAGRALAYAFKSRGLKVSIFDRIPEKARSLAADMDLDFGGTMDEIASIKNFDVIANATPVGSRVGGYAGESVIPSRALEEAKGAIAFDAVYLPNKTKFLQDAESHGLITVGGAGMLLHQAVFQVEKFTGGTAPVEVMRKALMDSLKE
jgi:shikimate dehydrogenase